MATRLVAETTNSYDFSRRRVAEIISQRIMQVIAVRITDDVVFVQRLREYVADSEKEHKQAEYSFPCVLFYCGPQHPNFPPPPSNWFVLGPVTFKKSAVFLEEFQQALLKGEKKANEKALEHFREAAEKYGWVASVKIPRCAPDVSRQRAEEVVEAAINLMKVFIGLRHARAMRLPHTAPSRNRETCLLTEIEGVVEWNIHGRSLEGALVSGNPLTGIAPCVQTFASDVLNCALLGNRAEVTSRLLDALKWFGDASFEESGGVQIVKWIAALERLVATQRLSKGITHNFCTRVAILATNLGAGNLANAYSDAHRAYDLRSDVMHGSRSQDDEYLSTNTALVHDLTREAIIGALSLHHFLAMRVGDGKVENMGRLYEQLSSEHKDVFNKLRNDLRGKFPRHK